MKCEAVHFNRDSFTIQEMCEGLGLNKSTYYKWLKGYNGQQEKLSAQAALARLVRKVFEENKRVYGYRKMQRALEAKGIVLSVYKVRKIMRETGLYPELQIKFKPYPNSKSDGRYSENTLKQQFQVPEPNKVWAGDITYVKTTLGWVYLAVVMDLFNREIIGYTLSKTINTELVKRALGNALPRNDEAREIMFHSDRGTQYSSTDYNKMLAENSMVGSMSRAGCPYDNSCVEGFFATLKKECIYKRKYDTMEEIESDLFEYIELFYNRKRLHATLGYLSPVQYRMQTKDKNAA
jgi:transposase InsO family protein